MVRDIPGKLAHLLIPWILASRSMIIRHDLADFQCRKMIKYTHQGISFSLKQFSKKGGHRLQYNPRNMHTVFALLCFVVVIHWLIFPYPSGLLHWHCGNLTIAPVPAKQPWWIWINTSCEFIMNDCITTTKQSTTKPCAYFLGYTVPIKEVPEIISRCLVYKLAPLILIHRRYF